MAVNFKNQDAAKRRRQRVMVLALHLFASTAFAQPSDCTAPDDPAAAGVYAARKAFNQAIVEKDIDGIRTLLAEDVLLVTGTDSTVLNGRDEQARTWLEDFEAGERAIYIREATCVSVSPLLPIALERGAWHGVMTNDDSNFAGGSYSAKWRMIDGRWQLEAELFATERCGGSFCPSESDGE